MHLLLEEFEEERSRSRTREALWISLVFHMALFILILLSPKILPKWFAIPVVEDAKINDRDTTFLEMPPDLQQRVPRQQTNQISDKDRIASSRNPVPDQKTLRQLRDFRRPGDPGMTAPQAPQQPAQQPQAQQQQQPQAQPPPQRPPENQTAQLQTPPAPQHPFTQRRFDAGSAIEEAARATARGRSQGQSGDYGIGEPSPNSGMKSDLEVLSDTMGVDFGPYIERVLREIRMNWYNLIPEVARPPLMRQGQVSIEFAITKNGGIAGMKLSGPSGDVSLDRAAWGGITASNPFAPLPSEFKGEYLALRLRFIYNPDRGNALK